MNKKYQNIWKPAVKYLRRGLNKDFVVHTKGVVKAMELILKKEKGKADILIPAAILHDVGWAKVTAEYQRTKSEQYQLCGLRLHLEFAPEIIREILGLLDYEKDKIKEIIEIVLAHKFKRPRKLEKRLLIDADNLADSFKEQFYSDVKAYRITPEELSDFRLADNYFYTKTAADIFKKEMRKRQEEFKGI